MGHRLIRCSCTVIASLLVLALSRADATPKKGAKAVEAAPQRPDILAKLSSGSVIFDANGITGATTIKTGFVSLSTDDPYCVASPTKPCRYTLNHLDIVANDLEIKDVPVRGLHAFNWFPAVGVVDDGSGMRLSLPPGMPFNFSGTVGKSPVAFTVTPTEPSLLALVVDPTLQKIAIMGSLSGSRDGWSIKVTIHATSAAPFDNLPPLANAGPDQTLTTDCFAMVSLDKSKTTDPNGDLAYSYYSENGYSVGEGTVPIAMLPGEHRVTLNAFDSIGARGRDDVSITVKDDGTTKPIPGATLFSVEVPHGTTVEKTGILATSTLLFMPQSALTGGDAVSLGAGVTSLFPDTTIDGDLWSIGSVQLQPNARVTGTVHTQGTIAQKPGASIGGIDQGSAFTPSSILSWNAVIPALPGPPIAVGSKQAMSISPGNFGDISLGPSATLSLKTGTYFGSTLSTKPGSVVKIDDSAGPVILYLRGGIDHKGAIETTSTTPQFLVASTSADVSGPWAGTLLVPKGRVALGPPPKREHRGAVFAGNVELHSALAHASFPWETFRGSRQACAITPILACVRQTGPNAYVARFDYQNGVTFSGVTVPRGSSNRFLPAPEDRGQPTAFLAGLMSNGTGNGAFEVPFDGNEITWVVGGRSVAASSSSPRCP